VQLYNIQRKDSDNPGNYYLIGQFTLSPLEAGYGYYDLSRTVPMENDVDYPWMMVVVKEKYKTGYQISDDLVFTKSTNPVSMRPPSSRNFRVRTKKTSNNFFKNGVKNVAKAAGLIGTIGGIFFPPLTVVGAIGGAISSFLDD
jgi:hypothetical protein